MLLMILHYKMRDVIGGVALYLVVYNEFDYFVIPLV